MSRSNQSFDPSFVNSGGVRAARINPRAGHSFDSSSVSTYDVTGLPDVGFYNPSGYTGYTSLVNKLTGNPAPEGFIFPAASELNKRARKASKQQQTVAGENSLLPLIYGTQRVGPRISAVVMYQGKLHLRLDWCLGEVDAVVSVQCDDDTIGPLDATMNHYTGRDDQGVDPLLGAAFDHVEGGPKYTDTLPGICYTSYVTSPSRSKGFPRLNAVIRGMKVRTSQYSARVYSDEAAYCIADFIESERYGMGRLADWNSVEDVAAANRALVGGERKRILNLVLGTSDIGEAWLQTLRDYAGCWAVPEGNLYRLVPDLPATPVMHFDVSNIIAGTLRLAEKSTLNQETVVQVDYTNTEKFPYRTESVFAYADGVQQGTMSFRLSRIGKPGITRHSEANRYAIERLNDALTSSLSGQFVTDDTGITLRVGDIISVTHPIGLSAKLFRALRIDPVSPGRWQISIIEYDPTKYSSEVVHGSSIPDTNLQSPLSPPAPTNLVMTPDIFQDQAGLYHERGRFTWSAPAGYPFTVGYVVTVKLNDELVDSGTPTDPSYTTKALAEQKKTYDVSVATRTEFATGPALTATYQTTGKEALPSDIKQGDFTGFEVGGEVRLQWIPSVDLDLTAHELRYSATNGTWVGSILLDRVAAPAVRYQTKVVPPGTWRFWIKGLDSVRTAGKPYGQESANAAYVDITVTSDANAFLAGNYDFVAGTPAATFTNMTFQRVMGTNASYYVSDDGTTWDTAFANALSTYTNPLWTYPGGFTSTYESEHHDFEVPVTGSWSAEARYENVSGSATPYLDLSNTDSGYTQHSPMTVSDTKQWAKLRVTSTGIFKINNVFNAAGVAIKGTVRVVTVGREETGTVTTSATGAATVTLVSKYTKAVSIHLTPATGATPRIATYDNVVVGTGTNSFDAYAFNPATGAQVAVDCTYTFKGV